MAQRAADPAARPQRECERVSRPEPRINESSAGKGEAKGGPSIKQEEGVGSRDRHVASKATCLSLGRSEEEIEIHNGKR